MKIITTVGTSIFDNRLKDKKKPKASESFKDVLEDFREESYSFNEYKNLSNEIEILSDSITSWYEKNTNASAEIKSILKIAGVEKPNELQEKVNIVLIATDTVLSKLACNLIYEWFKPYQNFVFKNYEIKSQKSEENYVISGNGYVVKNLSVNSKSDYDDGFMNLIKVLDDLKLNENDVLNITGGYKALIPIMTIYGQLKNIPLKYIYNESELDKSSSLINIFPLPINYDTGIAELYTFFLDNTYLAQDNINVEIVEKLKSWKLIDLHNEKYRVSAFGIVFRSLMEVNIQGGKNVLGSVVELKLFEFFYENESGVFGDNILNKEKYKIKKRGLKIGKKNLDIDLVFQNEKQEVAFCEVKSIKKLTYESSAEIIVNDIKKRHEAAKTDEINLKAYILIIHKAAFQDISYAKDTIDKMKESTDDLGINLFVYYYNIPIKKTDDDFNYQSFVQEPLDSKNFISYPITKG